MGCSTRNFSVLVGGGGGVGTDCQANVSERHCADWLNKFELMLK